MLQELAAIRIESLHRRTENGKKKTCVSTARFDQSFRGWNGIVGAVLNKESGESETKLNNRVTDQIKKH